MSVCCKAGSPRDVRIYTHENLQYDLNKDNTNRHASMDERFQAYEKRNRQLREDNSESIVFLRKEYSNWLSHTNGRNWKCTSNIVQTEQVVFMCLGIYFLWLE